ncbi:MAG: hypothetical protein KKD01_13735 [Proteobacteria bacterium]|nr:hypothetical protein [Pseudomonadota bacterium]MBU1455781.1 hypothetical protein [Pseudomonadota bacterium]
MRLNTSGDRSQSVYPVIRPSLFTGMIDNTAMLGRTGNLRFEKNMPDGCCRAGLHAKEYLAG